MWPARSLQCICYLYHTAILTEHCSNKFVSYHRWYIKSCITWALQCLVLLSTWLIEDWNDTKMVLIFWHHRSWNIRKNSWFFILTNDLSRNPVWIPCDVVLVFGDYGDIAVTQILVLLHMGCSSLSTFQHLFNVAICFFLINRVRNVFARQVLDQADDDKCISYSQPCVWNCLLH